MKSILKLCILFTSIVLVGCGGSGGSSSSAPTDTPEDMDTSSVDNQSGGTGTSVFLKNVEYGRGATDSGDMSLLLDIHQPSGICDENRPTIFFVHAGGFVSGNKGGAGHRERAAAANAKGFNYVSIAYRLAPDNPVLEPVRQTFYDDFVAANTDPTVDLDVVEALLAANEDAHTALNWLNDNADDYCLDMTSLAYWGASAGATTVLSVAYTSDDAGFSRPAPAVVVNYYGGLLNISNMEFMEAPFFTIHGSLDTRVPYQGALDLAARADDVGIPYAFYTEVGGGHGVSSSLTVRGTTILDLTLDFIEAHIVGGIALYETANID